MIEFALRRLNEVVDEFWYEMSAHLVTVEELHESMDLPEPVRQLAALVASRVYFHLGEFDDSIQFALGAGKLFNPTDRTLYSDTILGKCIDLYISNHEAPDPTNPMDPRLEQLVCSLAEAWLTEDPQFRCIKELLGLAVKSRRLDLVKDILTKHVAATGSAQLLSFCISIVNTSTIDIVFRTDVLREVARMYSEKLSSVDYVALVQCLVFLNDAAAVAAVIHDLVLKNDKLMAYQIAFDLFDQANQEFLQSVVEHLQKLYTTAEIEGPKIDPNLPRIIGGEVATKLYVKFLYSQCKADIHVLNQLKKSLDSRNSVTHNATVIANAMMYCGTTIDGFLRDNLDWLGRATNWARFTATATVGVIHKGHVEEAMGILQQYLPSGPVQPLPFQEAGALYGLGLIHAPVGVCKGEVVDYLRNALRTYSANEQLVHGASLGLGLAALGLHSEELQDALFACVSGCDAVAGEAAAVAIGLVMMGSANKPCVEMLLNHAREDQKEKTIRGLSMAIALIMVVAEGNADTIIETMLSDRDPWVRLGGCYTLGLAYSGTNNSRAVERLLEIAVRDVSDEVRRGAVIQIGFVTLRDTQVCIDMTRILSDSYNPHIRYGVALAVGIAAAGSGNQDAVELLWQLKDDAIDFVRQGAFIALSLVLTQFSEKERPKVKELRTLLANKSGDRREDTCTKFGCIIATGILDACGRNCTIAIHKSRHILKRSLVGMFLFSQYWYWHPFTLMLSVAFSPTCFIGLNEQLEMPEYEFKSNAPPSQFALPKSAQVEKKEMKQAGVMKAVLSTTQKETEYRQRRRQTSITPGEIDSAADSTNIDSTKKEEAAKSSAAPSPTAGATAAAVTKEEPKEAVKEEEPQFEILRNPARVTKSQADVISHNYDQRYVVAKTTPVGICMLRDTKPELEPQLIAKINPMERDDEVKAPEPFEWP